MNADIKTLIEEINDKFNIELSMQVEGILPKAIELSSTRLEEKSKQNNHPYEIGEVKNLVLALNDPIAIFAYGDKCKSQNVIVELKKDDKCFIVGIFFNQIISGSKILSVRGLFNKNNSEWLNWIVQGKALYLNKQKIQDLIDQQRTNLADVAYLDLNLVESLLETFVNPI